MSEEKPKRQYSGKHITVGALLSLLLGTSTQPLIERLAAPKEKAPDVQIATLQTSVDELGKSVSEFKLLNSQMETRITNQMEANKKDMTELALRIANSMKERIKDSEDRVTRREESLEAYVYRQKTGRN